MHALVFCVLCACYPPPVDDKQMDDQYSERETAERMERGLRRALNMPHKRQVESSPKKLRAARKGRVRKGKSRR
jgi:hypothetical protein